MVFNTTFWKIYKQKTMKLFFAEHWELVITFIAILLSALGYFIKQMFKNTVSQENNMENRINKEEGEIKEIKDNYLDRFSAVMEVLGEIKTAIATVDGKVDAQKAICKIIQDRKSER